MTLQKAWYKPIRTDDLSLEAQQLVGTLGEWAEAWIIYAPSPYAGQMAYVAPPSQACIGWVPECDLEFVMPKTEATA